MMYLLTMSAAVAPLSHRHSMIPCLDILELLPLLITALQNYFAHRGFDSKFISYKCFQFRAF